MLKYILNDQIIDEDKAFVHVSDLSLLRGYGVFDFFRLVGLQPLYFEDHLARFFRSADALRLKCPVGRKQLRTLINEMIVANNVNQRFQQCRILFHQLFYHPKQLFFAK